jgi:hypothetical protein
MHAFCQQPNQCLRNDASVHFPLFSLRGNQWYYSLYFGLLEVAHWVVGLFIFRHNVRTLPVFRSGCAVARSWNDHVRRGFSDRPPVSPGRPDWANFCRVFCGKCFEKYRRSAHFWATFFFGPSYALIFRKKIICAIFWATVSQIHLVSLPETMTIPMKIKWNSGRK